MSTEQRNDACLVSVDPSTADILRRQTLIILEANHYYFEEILEFGPEAQHALSVIYRDAFAVLDAIGWRRPDDPPTTVGSRSPLAWWTSFTSAVTTYATPTLIAYLVEHRRIWRPSHETGLPPLGWISSALSTGGLRLGPDGFG